MAKAKRANHRTGSERIDEPAWESAATPGSGAPGTNGHPGQNGHGTNGRGSNAQGTNGRGSNGQGANGHPSNGSSSNGPGGNGQPGTRPPQYGPQEPGQNGQPQGQSVQVWRTVPAPEGQNGRPVERRMADLGTPVKVDEIAVAALALSENLQAAARGLPESVASRQFRRDLDDAADTFREAANELETTASNLIRLAANEGQVCGVVWGECSEHGLTLMNAGEKVTCHVLGCHREYEGAIERCTQPAAYRVVDAAGPALLTCAGHAIACRLHFEGAVITLASDSLELL